MKCPICSSKRVRNFVVNGRAAPSAETFRYGECTNCGFLFLNQIINDWSKYYPDNYNAARHREPNLLKKVFLKEKEKYSALGKGIVGWAIEKMRLGGSEYYTSYLKAVGAKRDWKILDIGCADGERFLRRLESIGFTNLYGQDPFCDEYTSKHLKIRKNIDESDFDLITMFHSLEHRPDYKRAMKDAKGLLKKGGRLIVEIPLKSDYFWKKYRDKYFHFHPPRHVTLHTQKSFSLLCEQFGFKIEKTVQREHGLVVALSEAYARGETRDPADLMAMDRKSELGPYLRKYGIDLYASERWEKELFEKGDYTICGFVLRPI